MTKRRDRRVNASLDEEAYQLVADVSRDLGVSRSELVRLLISKLADDNHELNKRSLIGRDVDQIKSILVDLMGQLGRLGNNVNQLTKRVNKGEIGALNDPDIVTELKVTMSEISEVVTTLWPYLR